MKNTIVHFFENNSKAKVLSLKTRHLAKRVEFDEMIEADYNPKRARNRSLKGVGLKPGKY